MEASYTTSFLIFDPNLNAFWFFIIKQDLREADFSSQEVNIYQVLILKKLKKAFSKLSCQEETELCNTYLLAQLVKSIITDNGYIFHSFFHNVCFILWLFFPLQFAVNPKKVWLRCLGPTSVTNRQVAERGYFLVPGLLSSSLVFPCVGMTNYFISDSTRGEIAYKAKPFITWISSEKVWRKDI